jgi:hypothetical protein
MLSDIWLMSGATFRRLGRLNKPKVQYKKRRYGMKEIRLFGFGYVLI